MVLIKSPVQTVVLEKPIEKSKIYIKHMVSLRCKMVVKDILNQLGLAYGAVELGEVEILTHITDEKREQLASALVKPGFELMESKKSIIVEKIKNIVIEMVHYADELPKMNFSDHISDRLKLDFHYLSQLFKEVKGMTIMQFIIINKIEKVKELMQYDDLTLTEIAFKMDYSSVAHLSNQFKQITGFTPSTFKSHKSRIALENL